MSEMVDQVARALYRAHHERGRRLYPEGAWERLDRFEQEAWRCSARAAIEAMREPTLAMQQAGASNPRCEWEAMIDAALYDSCTGQETA